MGHPWGNPSTMMMLRPRSFVQIVQSRAMMKTWLRLKKRSTRLRRQRRRSLTTTMRQKSRPAWRAASPSCSRVKCPLLASFCPTPNGDRDQRSTRCCQIQPHRRIRPWPHQMTRGRLRRRPRRNLQPHRRTRPWTHHRRTRPWTHQQTRPRLRPASRPRVPMWTVPLPCVYRVRLCAIVCQPPQIQLNSQIQQTLTTRCFPAGPSGGACTTGPTARRAGRACACAIACGARAE